MLRLADRYETMARALEPILLWERHGGVFHSMTQTPSGIVEFLLIVERMPDGSWEWTAWRPGEAASQARGGVAKTVQDAMREAERAAGP
jgi:hypothetical protein